MLDLIWMIPFGAFLLYGIWRFMRGAGPSDGEAERGGYNATNDSILPPSD